MAQTRTRASLIDRQSLLRMTGSGMAVALTATTAISLAEPTAPEIDAPDGKAQPVIAPLETEFTLEAQVNLDPAVEMGSTSRGIRRYIPITGGTFSGPKIKGVVLPGGADWQLERPDGVLELNALYSIKADDGAVIIVHNRGLLVSGGSYFRTTPEFEAPRGTHDWLNKAVFVGSVTGAGRPGAVLIRVFKVL